MIILCFRFFTNVKKVVMQLLKQAIILLLVLISLLNTRECFAIQTFNPAHLSIQLTQKGASKIAQVSFGAMQGHQGILRIYNAQHKLVKTSSIELIGLPYYASIDISGMQSKESYLFEVTTDNGITETLILTI